MVSQPVKAIILLFPDTGELAAKRDEVDAKIEKDGQPALDPTIFWMKQTVG
jgi:ubiquitin carboxyl-terminal hydrolase L3